MNAVEAMFLPHPLGQSIFSPKGTKLFADIAYRTVPFLGKLMAVDMHTLQVFILLVKAFACGAND